MFKKYENAKLLLRLYDRTLTAEWPNQDIDLDELLNTFIGLLVGQTFSLDSIHEYIIEWAKDLEELKNHKVSENAV